MPTRRGRLQISLIKINNGSDHLSPNSAPSSRTKKKKSDERLHLLFAIVAQQLQASEWCFGAAARLQRVVYLLCGVLGLPRGFKEWSIFFWCWSCDSKCDQDTGLNIIIIEFDFGLIWHHSSKTSPKLV